MATYEMWYVPPNDLGDKTKPIHTGDLEKRISVLEKELKKLQGELLGARRSLWEDERGDDSRARSITVTIS